MKNPTPAARSSDSDNHSYDYRPNWTPLSPITVIYCPCMNYIRQVKNVWKVCGRVITSTQQSNFTYFSGSSWTLDVKYLNSHLFLTFLTAIWKRTDPTTERLSKKCYRSKLVLMINVETAYHLDISGKIEGEKRKKEAELVF